MNAMKRVGMAALLVVGVTLLASTPAQAKKPGSTVFDLTPPQDSPPEPGACGTCQCDTDTFLTEYTGEATVSCGELTAGNEYDVQFLVKHWQAGVGEESSAWYECVTRRVAADRKGRLTTQLSYAGGHYGGTWVADACVRNDQGDVVLLGLYDSWLPVSY